MKERFDDQTQADSRLAGVRVLGAINGIELFGHERSNIEVFRTLRALGAQVRVGVHPIEDNHVRDELERSGIETFSIPFGPQWSIQWVKRHPSLIFTNFWKVWTSSRAFSKQVRNFDPTHFHIGSPLVYSYLSLALKRHSRPLVYRMGNCPPVDSRFNLRIWKMAVRRADHLVSISEFVRQEAKVAGGKDSTVIYNLAPTFVASDPDRVPERTDFPGPRLLYVGAVSEYKGVGVLIQALGPLKTRYPDLCLDIIGGSRYDAVDRSKLVQVAKDLGVAESVHFHGHVSNPVEYYKSASLHVHPALWPEPLGNVVMEAKREGTPSVVFRSGGLPEMIRHKIDGYVCAEHTPNALVDAIDWSVAEPARLNSLGRNARASYDARFGTDRFNRQWSEIYLRMGSGR